MKLTVLLDNNTFIDRNLFGEPGVSYLIEDRGRVILFDVGYSDMFIRNANKIGVDLYEVDDIVLSHGHLDHTWGLMHLFQFYTDGIIEGRFKKKPRLIAHPRIFSSRAHKGLNEIGSLLQPDQLEKMFEIQLSAEVFHLSERLVFLGEIERKNDYEGQKPIGKLNMDGEELEDFLVDDSALAYRSPDGLVIITGCSHSGISNIVEQAIRIMGDNRVLDIIGGLHLLKPSNEQLQGTLDYMVKLRPDVLHACHCTDLSSKIALSRVANLKEVGVGLTLEF